MMMMMMMMMMRVWLQTLADLRQIHSYGNSVADE